MTEFKKIEAKINIEFHKIRIFPDEYKEKAIEHIKNLKIGIKLFKDCWSRRPTNTFLNLNDFGHFSNNIESIFITNKESFQYIDFCSMYRCLNKIILQNLEKLLVIPSNTTDEEILNLKSYKEKCITAFDFIKQHILYIDTKINWDDAKDIVEKLKIKL
jgi:hypothetical protein